MIIIILAIVYFIIGFSLALKWDNELKREFYNGEYSLTDMILLVVFWPYYCIEGWYENRNK